MSARRRVADTYSQWLRSLNGREDQIAVSRLAWDMAQWELHYLRGLFGTVIVEDTLHARNGKRLRDEYGGSMFARIT